VLRKEWISKEGHKNTSSSILEAGKIQQEMDVSHLLESHTCKRRFANITDKTSAKFSKDNNGNHAETSRKMKIPHTSTKYLLCFKQYEDAGDSRSNKICLCPGLLIVW
jgi:hypothetical protein